MSKNKNEEGEMALLHLRTERVTAKQGYGSRLIKLVSVDGRTFEGGTAALGQSENRFAPSERDYEIPIIVHQGTRFERVEFLREKYDPSRHEKLVIDLPGGI